MKNMLVGFLLTVVPAAVANASEGDWSREKTERVIWDREMAIFEGRSRGDISCYLNATSSAYPGWPMPTSAMLISTMRISTYGHWKG